MANRVTRVFDLCFALADAWHREGRTVFPLSLPAADDELAAPAMEILYHDYQMWHLIEAHTDPVSGRSLFLDHGRRHNVGRNEAVERLDDAFCRLQRGTGPYNSETLASVFDRTHVQYLKALHLEAAGDRRAAHVRVQVGHLVGCAAELFEDMLAGRRHCFPLSRFKIDYVREAYAPEAAPPKGES
jgi:hypothetical protein